MVKAYGFRPLWIALASVAFTHLSWSASADEAGFPDAAAAGPGAGPGYSIDPAPPCPPARGPVTGRAARR